MTEDSITQSCLCAEKTANALNDSSMSGDGYQAKARRCGKQRSFAKLRLIAGDIIRDDVSEGPPLGILEMQKFKRTQRDADKR